MGTNGDESRVMTTRILENRNCAFCADLFRPRRREQRYCSRKCSDRGRSKRLLVRCALCKKHILKKRHEIKRAKTGLLFCNRACKEKAQSIGGIKEVQPDHYKDGRWSYRSRAFRKYGAKCKSCGYFSFKKMLDVDHIDGDKANNKIENLQVLCVWCHAIKTRKVPYHLR